MCAIKEFLKLFECSLNGILFRGQSFHSIVRNVINAVAMILSSIEFLR